MDSWKKSEKQNNRYNIGQSTSGTGIGQSTSGTGNLSQSMSIPNEV